jgi:hypothetical protein
MSKYLPYVLVVAAFVLGYLLKPGPDEELERKYIQDRIIYQQTIDQKNDSIRTLDALQSTLREKAKRDSLRFSERLKAKDTRIAGLTNKLKSLDFTNSTTEQLDSLSAVLYGTTALR